MRPDLLERIHPDLLPYLSLESHTDADYRALKASQMRGRKVKVFSKRSQCEGKRRHSTLEEARKAAKRMGKLGLTQYECVHCGWCHVGRAR